MAEYIYISGRERPDFIINNNYLSNSEHFEMHVHYMLEFNVQKEGYGVYHIDKKKYHSAPGDIFIISNTEPHQLVPNPDSVVYNLNVHFDPMLLRTPYEESSSDTLMLAMFYRRTENFSNLLDRDNPSTAIIYRLFMEIEREAKEKKPLYNLKIKTLLDRICLEILQNYDYCQLRSPTKPNAKMDFYRIGKVLDYIDYNISKNLTLEDISKVACMNSSYFSSLFKRYCGISLFEYISQKRVEYSSELLKTTSQGIADIAYICGFNNLTSFNKAFLKVIGCQPSVYRRHLNENSDTRNDMPTMISPVILPSNSDYSPQ